MVQGPHLYSVFCSKAVQFLGVITEMPFQGNCSSSVQLSMHRQMGTEIQLEAMECRWALDIQRGVDGTACCPPYHTKPQQGDSCMVLVLHTCTSLANDGFVSKINPMPHT